VTILNIHRKKPCGGFALRRAPGITAGPFMALLSTDFPLLSAAIAASDLSVVTEIMQTESNDTCRNGRNGAKFCEVEGHRLVMASKVVRDS